MSRKLLNIWVISTLSKTCCIELLRFLTFPTPGFVVQSPMRQVFDRSDYSTITNPFQTAIVFELAYAARKFFP